MRRLGLLLALGLSVALLVTVLPTRPAAPAGQRVSSTAAPPGAESPADEYAVFGDISQARTDLQRRQLRSARGRLEQAETALLNNGQIGRVDPRWPDILRQLRSAREAIDRKDLRAADMQLAVVSEFGEGSYNLAGSSTSLGIGGGEAGAQ